MDFKPKYIKDNGYDVSDEYLQALDEMDFELSLVISKHIDDNVIDIEPTSDISEIRGGIVHHEGVAYPYALEMIKIRGSFLIITPNISINTIPGIFYYKLPILLQNYYPQYRNHLL